MMFNSGACLCTAARVVAVSRRAESLADRQKLGNPTEDKLVIVPGNMCE